LFADLLSFAQKGNTGHKWAFDDAMVDGGKIFKDTIIEALENNKSIKNEIKSILKLDAEEYATWADKLKDKLDYFVEVIPKK
jgi:hypothetical protein